jgi:hypothetical protein
MAVPNVTPPIPDGGEALKSFQLSPEGIARKSAPEYGRALGKMISDTVYGTSSYYALRNDRFKRNRAIAHGRLNVYEMFKDRLQMDGKTNYVNLNWSCIKLGNRIVSGLVGRWMTRGEKVVVTAKDSLSLKEKQAQYEEIEWVLENRARLEALQQESGVPLIPEGDLPEDQQGLHLWATQIQKLPEEICYEMGCNDVLSANGLYGVLKEKLCHDAAEVAFVGTYTWMDESGVIHTEWVKPENAVYSHSEYDDFRDTTYRGQVKSYKISELRSKYGVEFGGKLTEEELFEIASTGRDYQTSDKLAWTEDWIMAAARPYDERNVDVLEFEVKTKDVEPYTIVQTKKHRSTLIKKGRPRRPGEGEQVVEDTKWNIYRGVYLRENDKVLEWGLKTNMIRPQDPKEIGNAEFSYSFYMPQSQDMRNIAVPEKIEAALEGMILARLKMDQCIAAMRPAGAAINVDALQELDLGLGKLTTPDEASKIYDQTGKLYYRGKDTEGNPMPIPINELQNAGFLPQMQALIQLYQFHYSVLRDELGEDPNLMSQAMQPRVAAQNVQTSQAVADAATDYLYRAVTRVMGDTATKVACLLKDSVVYGSSVYRALLDKEDVDGRIFSTDIQMLPTEMDVQRFEAWLNQAIAANPDLVLFFSPMQLLRVAKENVKLAEELFFQSQRKMIRHQRETASANAQQTIEGQIQSAQMAEQAKQATEQLIGEMEIEKAKVQGEATNKSAVISMVTGLLGKGVPVPSNMQPLVQAVVESLIVPMVAQTEEQKQFLLQQMKQAQGEGEGGEMQGQMPPDMMQQEQAMMPNQAV